ncbi:Homeobox-leucine zipper protein HAT22 [Heracleum sosnowskyi]|uniref:Homeobox-leucine zipper protein HAT22 n=1 Tax=Heracleum sosnowskyi TaxID=360622 RepID=A0AAD8MBQ6_9APIA|nr:Homeobox-leucine zipper protein HAT22 [Heracleum sosnowskyi]
MNFEDLSYSSLTLALDYSERPKDRKISQVSSSEADDHQCFPSLTLGLSLEPRSEVNVESRSVILERQVSSISVVSSLTNSDFMKSKRDARTRNNQELEGGRVVHDQDQDEDESAVRKKLKLDRYQSRILEGSFKDHSTLNLTQKQALARRLNLRPRQVEVWYQNRRARNKLKQTEMECEMLKNCFEKLKDENRRLQKEVQQLKETKGKGMLPLFDHMQLPPAANLTVCPFCERISGSVARQISL